MTPPTPLTSPRRRMTAEGRREQLLDAWAAIADTEGFHAASLDRMAADCGVTRTVLYQQFGGLDGMLDALIERAGAAVASATAAGATLSLGEAMARVVSAVDADPATWRMFPVAPPAGPLNYRG